MVKLPELTQRADVDAELLQDRALHLGDADAQHHLLLAFDDEQIDHRLGRVDVLAALRRPARYWSRCSTDSIDALPILVVVAVLVVELSCGPVTMLSESRVGRRELRGDLGGPVGIDRRAHRAGQHQGAAGDLAVHVRAGDEAGQQLIERREVGADGDLEREDLLAVLVEEEGVGLTRLLGNEEHPVGRLHDRVEHGRIRNQDVLQRHGKLHDDRATDAEVDPLR